jgi:hypothetical protein
MARKTIILLEDDITGGDADETVNFSLDGKHYEIDLTTANAQKLRAAFEPFISAGRKSAGAAKRRGAASSSAPGQGATRNSSDSKVVREWATANGIEVPTRGRIPAEVRQQYDAAH